MGRRVELVPLTPKFYDFLWDMEQQLGFRFRFRGATPSPDEFVGSLWQSLLVGFVMVRRDNQQPVGLATAYQEDFRNAHAFIAVGQHPLAGERGYAPEGLVLLLNYCFEVWPFQKLYAEANEYNVAGVSRLREKLFVEEGRLRNHEFYGGRWWDKLFFAVYRSRWEELGPRLLDGATPFETRRERRR